MNRKALTRTEAKTLQRRYQRQGYTTWLHANCYSGQERVGLQFTVIVLTPDGKEHYLYQPTDRVGGTRIVEI